jgi:hypothetical protein
MSRRFNAPACDVRDASLMELHCGFRMVREEYT